MITKNSWYKKKKKIDLSRSMTELLSACSLDMLTILPVFLSMRIIYSYLFNLSLYPLFLFALYPYFCYEGSHRGRTHRSPSRGGFSVRSYLCPYKWRIYKGAFYNALRESRRCKESCRMRWGGERGLIILSRTISCQPRAATLA